jgi:hypothetical protein
MILHEDYALTLIRSSLCINATYEDEQASSHFPIGYGGDSDRDRCWRARCRISRNRSYWSDLDIGQHVHWSSLPINVEFLSWLVVVTL